MNNLVEDYISRKFDEAWNKFCSIYKEHGNYDQDKVEMEKNKFDEHWSRIWKNKMFFSEYDIVLHLSKILIEKFGIDCVHNNVPVDKMFFHGHDEKERYRIDIAIIDPNRYANGAELRKATWNIFAEVKYISVGLLGGAWGVKHILDQGIPDDVEKLQKYKSRCDLSYMCIIDDYNTQYVSDLKKNEHENEPVKIKTWQHEKEGRTY